MKVALGQRSVIAGKINSVLNIIQKDLAHSFMLSVNKDKERVSEGKVRSIFKYSNFSGKSKLQFTTMFNTNVKKDTKEGETAYVVYELRDSEKLPGRTDLYRGSIGVIPSDFRNDPPMKLIMEGVREFKLEFWNGNSWIDNWNTEKSDFRQSIPRLVRVSFVAYTMKPFDGDDDIAIESNDFDTRRTTIVHLPYSERFKELKPKTGSVTF